MIIAREAIISEITKGAPNFFTKRRKGKSVTPDIGARRTLPGNVIFPIWIIFLDSGFDYNFFATCRWFWSGLKKPNKKYEVLKFWDYKVVMDERSEKKISNSLDQLL